VPRPVPLLNALIGNVMFTKTMPKQTWDVNNGYLAVLVGRFPHVKKPLSHYFRNDCLPVPTFLGFCEILLDYYRDDERIWVISGNNFQDGIIRSPCSYYSSQYPHIWGWTTWRRAWRYWQERNRMGALTSPIPSTWKRKNRLNNLL